LRVLYIGGTGEISSACVAEAAKVGHQVTVFNRGRTSPHLPAGVEQIVGERIDYFASTSLAARNFDVVCQFLAFNAADAAKDIATFKGRCGQFVFVSSASVYSKPIVQLPINENTPIGNQFSRYSEGKLECEAQYLEAHNADHLPVTIIRPSHTYRHRLPSTIVSGDHLAWRLQNGKPVAVHGDGQSVWTLTHAEDFARAFISVCGQDKAYGQTVNITSDMGHTWNHILATVAEAIGVVPEIRPILSSRLEAAIPELQSTLSGDKANSLIFDMTKLKTLVPRWQCEVSLDRGISAAWAVVAKRLQDGFQPDRELDTKIDELIHQAEREAQT